MTHQYGDAPVEQAYMDQMIMVIQAVDEVFNGDKKGRDREIAIVMMIFKFGSEGRCNFMSNGVDRRDLVKLMKEMIARFEAQETVGTA